ncbi:MAG: hypothetical protein GTO46_07140 [Gemmatimonadetes bacterium]|nr:hypothetical protein [Gemmatimonadota bacterium]NIO31405.1 hypothetical protein [Gemmatimonadota bacterium]
MSRRATLALLLTLLGAADSHAQKLPEVRGYYLNVPLWSDSTQFAIGGFGDLQRLRLMTEPALGPLDLDVAYEHLLSYSQRAVSAPVGSIIGGLTPGGGEWLDLQWTIEESDHWLWRHRFDRISLRYAGDAFEATVGRQTISWATTLFLTPADPFMPFDPADPFREYRGGVDAIRFQAFPSALSDIDLVLRMSETGVGETLTALARGRTVWRGWELSAWAGALHESAAAAAGAAGSIGPIALRAELSVRDEADDLVFRGTIGADTRVAAFDRDLYLVLEYQHDDFGAAGSAELLGVVFSDPLARGEMQVLGRDEVAAQAAFQAHPLLGTTLLVLCNLNDPSALIFPGASYSLSNEVTLQAGIYLGIGDGTPESLFEIPSEYGIVPTTVYLSLTAFF